MRVSLALSGPGLGGGLDWRCGDVVSGTASAPTWDQGGALSWSRAALQTDDKVDIRPIRRHAAPFGLWMTRTKSDNIGGGRHLSVGLWVDGWVGIEKTASEQGNRERVEPSDRIAPILIDNIICPQAVTKMVKGGGGGIRHAS